MKSTITATAIPAGSEISRHLAGAHFQDCFATSIEAGNRSALELFLDVIARTPSWVHRMMALRNKIVGLVGLKNLGHLARVDPSKPAHAYRIGDRVGIFSIRYLSDAEVILGDSDKHLDVQVSVCKLDRDNTQTVAVSTVVHIHNFLGRAYMCLVGPMHKLIVPATLSRAGQ